MNENEYSRIDGGVCIEHSLGNSEINQRKEVGRRRMDQDVHRLRVQTASSQGARRRSAEEQTTRTSNSSSYEPWQWPLAS